MIFAHGESVILHRFVRDDYNAHGQAQPVFADEKLDDVAFAPTGGQSPDDGVRERVRWDAAIYVDPGTNVSDRDEVTVRGKRYRVVIPSGDWVDPWFGINFGAEVKLSEVVG